MSAPEVFAAVWVDRMVGPLHLIKATADEAIEAARRIRDRGVGKVDHVRAVRLTSDDQLIDLLES